MAEKKRMKVDITSYLVDGREMFLAECSKCGHTPEPGAKLKFESRPKKMDFNVAENLISAFMTVPGSSGEETYKKKRLVREIRAAMEAGETHFNFTKEELAEIKKGLDSINSRKGEDGSPVLGEIHLDFLGRVYEAEEVTIEEEEKILPFVAKASG